MEANASMDDEGAASRERRISVLVIEDEPTIADMVTLGLRYEAFDVMSAPTGEDGLRLARRRRPDIVILDLMLPGIDGIEVARRLRALGGGGIIMVTARGALNERILGLESGADDYLTKPFDFRELLARVRALLRRMGTLREEVLRAGDIELNLATHEARRGERPMELTPREFELLAALMAHPRSVLSKEALLSRVWGYDFTGDTNVVEVFISHLREKLGDAPLQPIQTVRGVGYTLRW
ncbi:MAG: winged helix-turn-helix domain-containing protein [Dehalococcoidia bacterium]